MLTPGVETDPRDTVRKVEARHGPAAYTRKHAELADVRT
jgi:hypothetical protein